MSVEMIGWLGIAGYAVKLSFGTIELVAGLFLVHQTIYTVYFIPFF